MISHVIYCLSVRDGQAGRRKQTGENEPITGDTGEDEVAKRGGDEFDAAVGRFERDKQVHRADLDSDVSADLHLPTMRE